MRREITFPHLLQVTVVTLFLTMPKPLCGCVPTYFIAYLVANGTMHIAIYVYKINVSHFNYFRRLGFPFVLKTGHQRGQL